MNLIRRIRTTSNRSYCVALPREVRTILKLGEADKVQYILKEDGSVSIEKVSEKENKKCISKTE